MQSEAMITFDKSEDKPLFASHDMKKSEESPIRFKESLVESPKARPFVCARTIKLTEDDQRMIDNLLHEYETATWTLTNSSAGLVYH